jgi:uncharacterized membrane-anchored protein YjiN (DUF445 family)
MSHAPLASRTAGPRRNHAGSLSLLAATAGFAALETLRHFGMAAAPAWSVLQSGFEAGMVGGCADWFAVSALFRPIPSRRFSLAHTDIIARSRAKLSLGIVDMVQNRWLSPAILAEQLGRLSASRFILDHLAAPAPRAQVTAAIRDLLGRFAGSLDAPEIAGFLDRALRDQLAGLELGPAFGTWLEGRIQAGDTRALWDFLAASLAASAEQGDFRVPIRRMLETAVADYKGKGPWERFKAGTGELFFDYDDAARSLGTAFGSTLRAVQQDPGHPLRAKLDEQFSAFAQRLASGDREACATLDEFQRRLTANAELGPLLTRIIARLQQTLRDELDQPGGDLARILDRLLGNLLVELEREPETQDRLDAWVRQRVLELAASHHHLIGDMVAASLVKLSDRDLVAQIEEKVGADLQYIRLNGAVVGSMVGMILALIKLALT